MTYLKDALKNLFKSRDLAADAAALKLDPAFLKAVVTGKPAGVKLSAANAVAIANLTGGSAHEIMTAQAYDELEALGVKPPKREVINIKLNDNDPKPAATVEKAKRAAKAAPKAGSTSPNHRTAVSPTAVHRFTDINK